MPTAAAVLSDLKKKSRETHRKTYIRHGMHPDRVIGVPIADLKPIAKSLKGQQEFAMELYDTGIVDAMYLAGMIADGKQMSKKQLQAWADASDCAKLISETTVPWVAAESEFGRELAMKWIGSKKEHVACAGWTTYRGLIATKPDTELDLGEIEALLNTIVKSIHSAPNDVRSTMNGFVISVGTYIKPLGKQAKAAAKAMGVVSIDMGDTACKVPSAVEYIAKREGSAKRKTIRC